jgi:hypothetical protein
MKKKSPWSRNDKIGAATLIATIAGILVALLFPEVRRAVGLEKPAFVPPPVSVAQVQAAKSESPATTAPPTQHKKSKSTKAPKPNSEPAEQAALREALPEQDTELAPAQQPKRRTVANGNTFENRPNTLDVQDSGTTFTHNIVKGMDATVSHGAYADSNDFEGKGVSHTEGDNSVMAGIRAAQRESVYECIAPCGQHGPFPDVSLGLPPDLPLARALHGSSRSVADQLKALITEGNTLVDEFCAGKDVEVLKKSERAWQAKVENVFSNLDPRLMNALANATSPRSSQSDNEHAGIGICNSIVVKIDVMILYENQLRGVGD